MVNDDNVVRNVADLHCSYISNCLMNIHDICYVSTSARLCTRRLMYKKKQWDPNKTNPVCFARILEAL